MGDAEPSTNSDHNCFISNENNKAEVTTIVTRGSPTSIMQQNEKGVFTSTNESLLYLGVQKFPHAFILIRKRYTLSNFPGFCYLFPAKSSLRKQPVFPLTVLVFILCTIYTHNNDFYMPYI